MIKHPDIELLLKYASGQLEPALAIAISLHQQNCQYCQNEIRQLESVGGEAIESTNDMINESIESTNDSFNRLMNKIEQSHNKPIENSLEYDHLAIAQSDHSFVNMINEKQFDQIEWQKVSSKISKATIAMNDPCYQVELLKFAPNANIPQHTHQGNEFTLVLDGDFSDHQGNYIEGDFITQTEEDNHQPVAGDKGCICMAITDAPLKFTGTLGPIFNWFNN